jgi:hypothetical protein
LTVFSENGKRIMKFFGAINQTFKEMFASVTRNVRSSKANSEEHYLIKQLKPDAEKGDADSQNNLGLFYANGIGVDQDSKEALHWLRKSAEQGYPLGLFNLGLAYLQGCGVKSDAEEAAKFFRTAADKGLAVAQFKMGEMYCEGVGVPRDYTKAAEWFRLAASRGDENAAVALKNLDHKIAVGFLKESKN